jgi:DNA-binding response OmpR family regulator
MRGPECLTIPETPRMCCQQRSLLRISGSQCGAQEAREVAMYPDDVLLVEDNPGDVALTTQAMAHAGYTGRVQVVSDGDEALDYVFQRGTHAHAASPGLILLDLNLPRRDGRTVLRAIRADPRTHDIPVIILTSSEVDRTLCVPGTGADDYFVKPDTFRGFIATVEAIFAAWERVARCHAVVP